MNTCSRKQATLEHVHVNLAQIQGETDNILLHFALPNNLDNDLVVRLLQNDTTTYQLEYVCNKLVNAWKETKKEEARKRKARELKKKAEMLAKFKRELNRALCQAHKVNEDGRGKPLQWWPLVEEWEKAKRQAKRRIGQFLLKLKKRSLHLPKYL